MGLVPTYPAAMVASGDQQRIRAANPVFGSGQWREMADLANWLIGRGAQLVGGNPQLVVKNAVAYGGTLAGNTTTYLHYVQPRAGHTVRMWTVGLSCDDAANAFGTFKNADGDVIGRFSFTGGPNVARTHALYRVKETDALDTTGLATLKVSVDDDSDSAVIVTGIGCSEVPWVQNSGVFDEQTLNTKEPIFDGEDAAAMPAVILAMDTARTYARRPMLFSWYATTDDVGQYISSTATTFTGTSNVFMVNPTFVTRRIDNGSTQRSVKFAARVQSVSGAGELKVTMTSGDSTTVSFNEASMAIITDTVDVNTEDMTTLGSDGGLQSGARDYMTVEMRRTTASSVRISGFWVGEDD